MSVGNKDNEQKCMSVGKKDNEQKMHSLSRGRIVGYTVSVSVSISALSGGYVPDTGTPQSSLSTWLCYLCMVVGRSVALP
jgi:hypothetical protein